MKIKEWDEFLQERSEHIDDPVFMCMDCNLDTSKMGEYYAVFLPVWLEAHPDVDGGMLCIGCLEQRLERKLTPADFIHAPVNCVFEDTKSKRLLDRLGYFAEQQSWDLYYEYRF